MPSPEGKTVKPTELAKLVPPTLIAELWMVELPLDKFSATLCLAPASLLSLAPPTLIVTPLETPD